MCLHRVAIKDTRGLTRDSLQATLHVRTHRRGLAPRLDVLEQRLDVHGHLVHFGESALNLAFEQGCAFVRFVEPQGRVEFQVQVDVQSAVDLVDGDFVYLKLWRWATARTRSTVSLEA